MSGDRLTRVLSFSFCVFDCSYRKQPVLSERRPTDPAAAVSPNEDLDTEERRLSVAAEQSDAMPPTKSPSKLIDSASFKPCTPDVPSPDHSQFMWRYAASDY